MQRSLTNELYRHGCFIRTLGSGIALGKRDILAFSTVPYFIVTESVK
jgi:hypothetical protein